MKFNELALRMGLSLVTVTIWVCVYTTMVLIPTAVFRPEWVDSMSLVFLPVHAIVAILASWYWFVRDRR